MRTDDLLRSLVDEMGPVRRLRDGDGRALIWAGFAAVFVGIGIWALGMRSDLSAKLSDISFLMEGASVLAVFVLSARSAFQLSVPGMERSASTRTSPIVGLLGWFLLVAIRHAPGTDAPVLESVTSLAGMSCVSRIASLALAPAVAIFAMLRKAAPGRRRWTGLFALLSASAVAALGTQLLCAKDDPEHILLWHFGPVLIAGLIGATLGALFHDRSRTRRSAWRARR
jgi:hypothetical protein